MDPDRRPPRLADAGSSWWAPPPWSSSWSSAAAYRQAVLPFPGLQAPSGVAVDAAGNVYVAASGTNGVLTLAPGSSPPTVVPLTGVIFPKRGGGQCRQRVRHRPGQQSGGEAGGELTVPL